MKPTTMIMNSHIHQPSKKKGTYLLNTLRHRHYFCRSQTVDRIVPHQLMQREATSNVTCATTHEPSFKDSSDYRGSRQTPVQYNTIPALTLPFLPVASTKLLFFMTEDLPIKLSLTISSGMVCTSTFLGSVNLAPWAVTFLIGLHLEEARTLVATFEQPRVRPHTCDSLTTSIIQAKL